MFAALMAKIAQWGLTSVFKWAGYALLAGAALWLWNDYQDRGDRLAVMAVELTRKDAVHAQEMRAAFLREEQYRADLVLQAEVSAERAARQAETEKVLAGMRRIKRPESLAHCPEVGPKTTHIFDRLRVAEGDTATASEQQGVQP